MAARRQPEATQGRRGLLIAATIAVSLGIAAWWLSGPDLAAETIVLQQQLLDEAADPKSCQQQLRQIMGNIDRLPAEAIRDVRRELGKSVSGLTRQATTRYLPVQPNGRRCSMLTLGSCNWYSHCLMQPIRAACRCGHRPTSTGQNRDERLGRSRQPRRPRSPRSKPQRSPSRKNHRQLPPRHRFTLRPC